MTDSQWKAPWHVPTAYEDPGEKAITEILGDQKLPSWNYDQKVFEPPWTEETMNLANKIIKEGEIKVNDINTIINFRA